MNSKRNAHVGNLGAWTDVVNECMALVKLRALEISKARGDVTPDEAERLITRKLWCHTSPEEGE